MNPSELADYLENHLGKELHGLLRAASEWHAQKHMNLCVGGYEVQTYAMDSAFLHARTLFEFFTEPKTGDYYYACDAYGLRAIQPNRYAGAWKAVLHAFTMHAQDRSAPQPLSSFDGTLTKHLKDMPVDFAQEVIELWQTFADALPQPLGQRARGILAEAVDQARPVLDNEFTQGKIIPPAPW
jgi:hypothetical protein